MKLHIFRTKISSTVKMRFMRLTSTDPSALMTALVCENTNTRVKSAFFTSEWNILCLCVPRRHEKGVILSLTLSSQAHGIEYRWYVVGSQLRYGHPGRWPQWGLLAAVLPGPITDRKQVRPCCCLGLAGQDLPHLTLGRGSGLHLQAAEAGGVTSPSLA